MSSWQSQRRASALTSGTLPTRLQRWDSTLQISWMPQHCSPAWTRLTCLNMILQVGFKMFLNTSAAVANWNAESTECSLVSPQCPDHRKVQVKKMLRANSGILDVWGTDSGGQSLDRFCGATGELFRPHLLQCPVRRDPGSPRDGGFSESTLDITSVNKDKLPL